MKPKPNAQHECSGNSTSAVQGDQAYEKEKSRRWTYVGPRILEEHEGEHPYRNWLYWNAETDAEAEGYTSYKMAKIRAFSEADARDVCGRLPRGIRCVWVQKVTAEDFGRDLAVPYWWVWVEGDSLPTTTWQYRLPELDRNELNLVTRRWLWHWAKMHLLVWVHQVLYHVELGASRLRGGNLVIQVPRIERD